ncbi:hypothetical protein FT888_03270 [Clostridium perfringens]|nr:hypothetical protein [Clostridium perfringens]
MNKEDNKYKRNYDNYLSFGEIKPVIATKTPKVGDGVITYSYEVKSNLKKYLDVIFKDEYFYSKNTIASIFDFNTPFVQKFMVSDFEPLFITKAVKDSIKLVDVMHNENITLNDDFDIYNSAIKFIKRVPDYKAVLLYKKSDIINWILKSNFKKEIKGVNNDGVSEFRKVNISHEDIELIFEKGLKTHKSIGELKEFKHPLQTTRFIKKELEAERYIRYTFVNTHVNNKTNKELIRYMIMY